MNNQQALLTDMLPAAVLLVDADRQVMAASPTWVREFGPDPLGPTGEFPHPDAHGLTPLAELIDAAIGHRRTDSRTLLVPGGSGSAGSVRMVDFRVGPWHHQDGTVGGATILGFDVSSQLATERALEQVNADLEFFAHTLSHDLQGPATRQRALTSGVLEDFADDLPTELRERLVHIDEQSLRLLELIAANRALTSLAGPGVELGPVDLGELIDQVVAELVETEVGVDARDLSVVVDVPRRIDGYPPFLQLLFRNLVRIALRSPVRPLALEILRVDDGIGSVYVVRHSWDGAEPGAAPGRDRRADDALDPRRLGLAIARKVVERHGGSLWVRPEADVHEVRFTLAEQADRAARPATGIPVSR